MPRAYWGGYGASKAALENLLLTYADETAYAGKLRCVYYQEFYVPRTPRVLSFPEANLGARA